MSDAKTSVNIGGSSVPITVTQQSIEVASILKFKPFEEWVSTLSNKDPNDQVLKEHVVITYQPRLPVPSLNFPEIPAGMLDGSGNFTGKASEEIKEETGIEIRDQDLIDLTELAYGDKYRGAYPSPGGCDEFIRLCLCIKEMDHKEVKSLEGKLCGLRDHGESITVGLVELDYLWKIPDMKALSALTLYDALKKNGKL
ncbi:14859_t:CDS:2 [Gigaspora margarita]|uniref:14859_t:CDS:1 n=1 Tax=Gigaspora margarita TaxID=4874 RepID=A0ABN7V4I7_GIGMA|nr:14859_t:CDS:2 [Gigaspora margarita]